MMRTIYLATLALGAALGFAQPVMAAYTLQLSEAGGFVVATGSGSVSLARLGFERSVGGVPEVVGALALAVAGEADNNSIFPGYIGVVGPTSFGGWIFNWAVTGSGPIVGINGFSGELFVPNDYVSGSPLGTSTANYLGTFASLGIQQGTYKYRLGTGDGVDTFTIIIGRGAPNVPEPASWALMIAGMGVIGAKLRARLRASMKSAASLIG